MSFGTAVRAVLGQYATFSGRARRSEYWWWSLAYSIVMLVLYVVAIALLGAQTITDPEAASLGAGGAAGALLLGLLGLFALATFLPSLAVTVRRLHDTSRSGWWYLITFLPFGGIVLLVFAVMDSAPGTNTYGPNPKDLGDGGYGPQGYGEGYAGQGYGAPAPYGAPPQ